MTIFGIELVPATPLEGLVSYATLAEGSGVDSIWVTDHFSNRNVYVTLAVIALKTHHLRLGVTVANPYLIHPAVTAQAIASVAEIAPGRVVIGIGSGDETTLTKLGVERKKALVAIREAVSLIRGLLEGHRVAMKGEFFEVDGAMLDFRVDPIQIYVTGQSPKILELGGEIGSGVLTQGTDRADVDCAMRHVRIGCDKGHRARRDLKVVFEAPVSISADVDEAIRRAIPVVSYIVAGLNPLLAEKYGISMETLSKTRRALLAGRYDKLAELLEPEIVDRLAICGTPEACTDRLSNIIKGGIDEFIFGPPLGPDPGRAIEILSTEVIPALREA